MAEPGGERGLRAARSFSTRAAARILAVPPDRIRYWIRKKLISAPAQEGRRYRFAFNDLLKLRTAKDLLQGRRRLTQVRRGLDGISKSEGASPAAALQLSSSGGRLLVRERGLVFEAESGQLLLGFEYERPAGKLEERFASTRMSARFEEARQLAEAEPGRAMAMYCDLIEHEPGNVELHLEMAALLERGDDFAGAIRHLAGAAMLAPGNAEVHLRLGALYRKQEESELALQSFVRAAQCNPQAAEAHRNLAELYEHAGRKREALRHLSQLHRLSPDN